VNQLFHLCRDFGELNVHERLNYVLGQVLGVKDFQQEQAYFLHKSRLHNRSLHGYGTVWGLEVQTAGAGETLEIQVGPGLAIDTQGREALVEAVQCARLNPWLAAASPGDPATANHQTLLPVVEGEAAVAVYVTLCYNTCETEAQPILGNPCRTDSGTAGVIQYTRLRDDFELKLSPQPPRQPEEDHIRTIGDLLAKVTLDPAAAGLSDEEAATLLQTLRDAVDDPARIPALTEVTLPAAQARELLRRLFLYWVTNTRPTLDKLHDPVLKLLAKISLDDSLDPLDETALAAQIELFTTALDDYLSSNNLSVIDDLERVVVAGETSTALRRAVLSHWSAKPQACQPAEDECILLAAVQFELSGANTVTEETLVVENLQRPYLLHTRLLQELLLRGGLRGPQGDPGADGEAATIAIGTVTSGTPASVTNSGTPTAAVLDFVLPPGDPGTPGADGTDGEAATITIGTVTSGTPADVTNSGTSTAAVLDFVLPQGERGLRGFRGDPGPGLNQLIVRPTEMLPYRNPDNPRLTVDSGLANGYPALVFRPGGIAVLSTLRPSSTPKALPPTVWLRLYCTAQIKTAENPVKATWQVRWRWVRAIGPVAPDPPFDEPGDIRFDTPDGTTDTVLLPAPPVGAGFSSDALSMELFGEDERQHLNVGQPLEMAPNTERADYLVVHLELADVDRPVHLLMAELRWKS
jgi:hypothetical protein